MYPKTTKTNHDHYRRSTFPLIVRRKLINMSQATVHAFDIPNDFFQVLAGISVCNISKKSSVITLNERMQVREAIAVLLANNISGSVLVCYRLLTSCFFTSSFFSPSSFSFSLFLFLFCLSFTRLDFRSISTSYKVH